MLSLKTFRQGRVLSAVAVACCLVVQPKAYPQAVAGVPINNPYFLTVSKPFAPPLLKGIKVDPSQPFKFSFILDTGNSDLSGEALKQEIKLMTEYFLAALTIPRKDLWVNLSPYEEDRVIPLGLEHTAMGEGLLSEDYALKELAASLTYPETPSGKAYWGEVNRQDTSTSLRLANARSGSLSVRSATASSSPDASGSIQPGFTKVWIMPDYAEVYQEGNTAFITKSRLKVLTQDDYLAMQHNSKLHITNSKLSDGKGNLQSVICNLQSAQNADAFKRHILPLIEKEVNEGKNFARLRQIFYALTLALWYKQNLKQTILSRQYVDKNKVNGIATIDKQVKEKIYRQYSQAFQKGAYDYIKKEHRAYKIIKRRYFSGGVDGRDFNYTSGQRLTGDEPTGVWAYFKILLSDFRAIPKELLDIEKPTAAVDAAATPQINTKLVEQMQTGYVDIAQLPEGKAKQGLEALRQSGIDAVVYGGANRDVLLGVPASEGFAGDIDIVLCVDFSAAQDLREPVKYRKKMEICEQALKVTAEKLHISVPELLANKFRIGENFLEVLGIIDQNGNMLGRADLFAGIFEAPELSINSIGIATDGRVIDGRQGLADAGKGIMRIAGNWKMATPQSILRTSKFVLKLRRYGMRLDRESEEKLLGFFSSDNPVAQRIRRYTRIEERLQEAVAAVARLREQSAAVSRIESAAMRCARDIITYERSVRNNFYEIQEFDVQELAGRVLGVDVLGIAAHRAGLFMPAYTSELKPPDSAKEIKLLLRNYIGFSSYIPLEVTPDFSGSKQRSEQDQMGIGVFLGDIYRAADTLEEATALLRRYGAEDFLKFTGLDLDQVEVQAREYFAQHPLAPDNTETGGVNMTKDNFVKFSGVKTTGVSAVERPEDITVENLYPVVLGIKSLKSVREFFTLK